MRNIGSLLEMGGPLVFLKSTDADIIVENINGQEEVIIRSIKNKKNVYEALAKYYKAMSAEDKSGFSKFLAEDYRRLAEAAK